MSQLLLRCYDNYLLITLKVPNVLHNMKVLIVDDNVFANSTRQNCWDLCNAELTNRLITSKFNLKLNITALN